MTIFMVKAILMNFLSFYRVDFSIDSLPRYMEYIEYNNGIEVRKKIISENETVDLENFFLKNKNNWRYDLTTYAPKNVFVSSKIKINCLVDNTVIVNYLAEKNEWIQISKKGLSGCPKLIIN